MKYLHLYRNENDFNQEYFGDEYREPWFSIVKNGDQKKINFDRRDIRNMARTPLTFEFLQGGEFSINYDAMTNAYVRTVIYSLNGGPKTMVTPTNAESVFIYVEEGDVIELWGNNEYYSTEINSSNNAYFYFGSTCDFNVKGNVMSLINENDFPTITNLTRKMALSHLFYGCEYLHSAANLVLPAKRVGTSCYSEMFAYCENLVYAPELPATELSNSCYAGMFRDCESLKVPPTILPADRLYYRCYYSMFSGCISLENAPKLPATEIDVSSYQMMFNGCTNLKTAPELPATSVATSSYSNMFNGCTSLTTAPDLPATTISTYSYEAMFMGCTALTKAPETLPAQSLSYRCYSNMFFGCKNITTAPVLPAIYLTSYCYEGMFSGCTNLNYIKAMFTTTPSASYTANWVTGVASTGTFVKNKNATWNNTGSHSVPSNWTIVKETP